MADPPLAGAVQLTDDCALAFEEPTTNVGTPGIVEGVTAAEAAEAPLVLPAKLEAVTVKV
jgi:hypothetical protein